MFQEELRGRAVRQESARAARSGDVRVGNTVGEGRAAQRCAGSRHALATGEPAFPHCLDRYCHGHSGRWGEGNCLIPQGLESDSPGSSPGVANCECHVGDCLTR